MIEIKKKREPSVLTEYRNKLFASYDNIHGARTGRILHDGSQENVYDVVLRSLINEQGGLCAYCMRRIPVKKGNPRATIEHIQPQHMLSNIEKLDYRNMLAVCPGNRNERDNAAKSCDAFRGSLPKDKQKMTVNPLVVDTLRNIEYLEDGTIFSNDTEINHDLQDVLNLNCKVQQLAKCRADALIALQHKVEEDNKGRTATKEYFQKLLHNLTKNDENKLPYVGILIKWLETKIK